MNPKISAENFEVALAFFFFLFFFFLIIDPKYVVQVTFPLEGNKRNHLHTHFSCFHLVSYFVKAKKFLSLSGSHNLNYLSTGVKISAVLR